MIIFSYPTVRPILSRDGGMVDTMDSKSIAARCESSSLSRGTKLGIEHHISPNFSEICT